MAASKWQIYNEAKKWLLTGQIDLDTSAMRIKILKGTKAAAVSDYTRSTFASLTHATGFKTTAIRSITGVIVGSVGSAKQYMFDSTVMIFTASASVASLQYAVIGVSNGKALGWCKLTSTAIGLAPTNTLKIDPGATGYFTVTGGTTA